VNETRLRVRAHAKINLSLHVAGVRPDGYHLLETVFQSLALHDVLTFEAWDGPFALDCSAPGVPTDERNLVWKAASLLWRCAGRAADARGVRARIVKRIPAQGGLGGGSADAAAALVALDALWRTDLGPDRLRDLAARLGADVPFFLSGGTGLGLDRGDEIYPLVDLPCWTVVLVMPEFGVSTPEAFGWWDGDRNRVEAAPLGRAAGGARLPSGHGTGVRVFNDLQAAVARRHPAIEAMCDGLRAAGAAAAAMTGSGSTVFGLFRAEEGGRVAAGTLAAGGWRTLITRTATRRQARPRPLEVR
jgi:4-diphosphocytidyl-2-C-methyl-D-erythritol kinase